MNWFDNRLNQKALYWSRPDRDGYGNYKWGFPDEFDTRWKDSGKSIRYDKNGAEVVSSSVVWIQNENILTGGYLMQGNLYSIEKLDDPPIDEAYEIELGTKMVKEYARQIIDVETIQSVYSRNIIMTKIWLK